MEVIESESEIKVKVELRSDSLYHYLISYVVDAGFYGTFKFYQDINIKADPCSSAKLTLQKDSLTWYKEETASYTLNQSEFVSDVKADCGEIFVNLDSNRDSEFVDFDTVSNTLSRLIGGVEGSYDMVFSFGFKSWPTNA